MKVLYGVVGEGMGHAMRSAVILEALHAAGHSVKIVASGRAAEYLTSRYPDAVTRITGLTMAYEDNTVKKLKTALQNLKAAAGIPSNLRAYLEMAASFEPDVVISDFESWTYAFARGQEIPVISVDNMQVIPRCFHDDDVLAGEMKDFLLTKAIVRAKLPSCNHYLITTFFHPRVKKRSTTLHPPILRPQILAARSRVSSGEHVLVYQSGTSHGALEEELKQVNVPFRIYGLRRDLQEPLTEGNLTFCPFSEDGFIHDLATSRAVIAGGGFTLMGEAITLGKPMLCVPLVGQFEQVLNAAYLHQLGYGERVSEITAGKVESFLQACSSYAANLKEFEHDNNAGLLKTLFQQMEAAVRDGPYVRGT